MNLFLDTKKVSWPLCFDNALKALRESWRHQWLGLPNVMKECVNFLNFQEYELTKNTRQMLSASIELAQIFEDKCLERSDYTEPFYHNRLHTADVLVVMTLQVAIETEHLKSRASGWMAAALLSAIVHDFEHPGRVNQFPSEIEINSLVAALPVLKKYHVAAEWVERVRYAVERSDFSMVQENHRSVQNQKFDWSQEWLAVLLNEADIMGSSISVFGQELSVALSEEWRLSNVTDFATVATRAGRARFLSSVCFSSHSSRVLMAQEKLKSQLLDTL